MVVEDDKPRPRAGVVTLSKVSSGGKGVLRGGQNAAAVPRSAAARERRGLLRSITLTLQRRLSSEAVVASAVTARDLLQSLYQQGARSAGSAVRSAGRATATAYAASTRAVASAPLPWPLKPLRDRAVLPAVRAIEEGVVYVVTDPFAMSTFYATVKAKGVAVPLLGAYVFAPTLGAVERGVSVCFGAGKVALLVLAAPIPSRETVAYVVTSGYGGAAAGARAAGAALRETYFYVRLVDAQLQRTLSRVRWDLLGTGPYGELSRERRAEVLERLCDRYLSALEPLRRYEFLLALRLHSPMLWAAILQVGRALRARGGAGFEGDLWLDADAPWRGGAGAIATGAAALGACGAAGAGHQWFTEMGKLPGEFETEDKSKSKWVRLEENEQRRLDREYALFRAAAGRAHDGVDGALGAAGLMPAAPSAAAQRFRREALDARIAQGITRTLPRGRTQRSCLYVSGRRPSEHEDGVDVPVDGGRHVVNLSLARRFPVFWRFMEPPRAAGAAAEKEEAERAEGAASPPPKERGGAPSPSPAPKRRRRRSLGGGGERGLGERGLGERVVRSLWVIERDTGDSEQEPLPALSAALLEDAFQFLHWYLGGRVDAAGAVAAEEAPEAPEAEASPPAAGRAAPRRGSTPALLTLQVSSWDGSALLVQFRSLEEIVASRKTLAGTLSPFGRMRVRRGAAPVIDVEALAGGAEALAGDAEAPAADVEAPTAPVEAPTARAEAPGAEDGEEDLREPVQHLVLVVHGIGEALEASDLGVVQMRSLVHCCNNLRSNHELVCAANREFFGEEALRRGRVEFLPVEWHTRFHRHVDRPPDSLSIHDITLDHIPLFRQFANDAFLDILYFMSHEYHALILAEVVQEMNRVVALFRARTPSFSGKVSIAAHSLGAIVCFDVLANQAPHAPHSPHSPPQTPRSPPQTPRSPPQTPRSPPQKGGTPAAKRGGRTGNGKGKGSEEGAGSTARVSTPLRRASLEKLRRRKSLPIVDRSTGVTHFTSGVALQEEGDAAARAFPFLVEEREKYPVLDFAAEHLLCLGSPIGAFMMLRRHHEALGRQYALPNGTRLYNIFHPYDPVAFRLEPIVLGAERHLLQPPELVPTWQGGYRMQYKVRRLFRRLVQLPGEVADQAYSSVEAGLTKIGLIDQDINHAHHHGAHAPPRAAAHNPNVLRRRPPAEGEAHGRRRDAPGAAGAEARRGGAGAGEGGAGDALPLYGRLCGGNRIDFALQEKEIEIANEYVFAIGAHTLYWTSKDLSFFTARQLLLDDDAIAEKEAAPA